VDSEAPSHWKDLLRPKRGWFVGGGLALLGLLVVDRLIPSAPDWLPWAWGILLLTTGLLFDLIRAKTATIGGAIAIYALLICFSAFAVFDPLAQRRPLQVQSITSLGEYSPNPQRDLRAQLKDASSPLYASQILSIANSSDETITFQALLKIEGEQESGILAATLAFGDKQGWSDELQGFFDAMLHSKQEYLLSPVTIGPNATIRGRFTFPIPVYINSDEFDEERDLWNSAIDPFKKLKGTAYIDLRELPGGRRLAAPIYVRGKKPAE
jgi:hypothetical protein